jgi:hypothetical protein
LQLHRFLLIPYIQNFETANDLGLLNGTQANKSSMVLQQEIPESLSILRMTMDYVNAYTIASAATTVPKPIGILGFGDRKATFSFDWKAQGESSYDYLRVWLVPSNFMPTPELRLLLVLEEFR